MYEKKIEEDKAQCKSFARGLCFEAVMDCFKMLGTPLRVMSFQL